MGASSTGGGTTSGRGGSGMAAWTGLSFGILRRADGDEDLAPWVFAMAISEKAAGGAHAAWAQIGGVRRKVALVWLLFGTYLEFK